MLNYKSPVSHDSDSKKADEQGTSPELAKLLKFLCPKTLVRFAALIDKKIAITPLGEVYSRWTNLCKNEAFRPIHFIWFIETACHHFPPIPGHHTYGGEFLKAGVTRDQCGSTHIPNNLCACPRWQNLMRSYRWWIVPSFTDRFKHF